jgi:hypothetical protein
MPTADETDVYVGMARPPYTPRAQQGRAPTPQNERSVEEDVVVTPQRRKVSAPKSAKKTTQAVAGNETEKTEPPPSATKDVELQALFVTITGPPRLGIAKKEEERKAEA